jgi:hypothetical protein
VLWFNEYGKIPDMNYKFYKIFDRWSFILLAFAECDDSLLFSGASSIPLCYIPFLSTLLHQLFFHPPSLHLVIYFLFYLSALLLPNSYIVISTVVPCISILPEFFIYQLMHKRIALKRILETAMTCFVAIAIIREHIILACWTYCC